METYDLAVECRACLSTNSAEYIDMDSVMAGDYTIFDCFNMCTNLRADREDELPDTICSACSHGLQIAFDFIQAARQADEVLRENLRANKLQINTVNGEQDEIEQLEYVESVEDLATDINDTEEHILELELGEMEDSVEKRVEYVDDNCEYMEEYNREKSFHQIEDSEIPLQNSFEEKSEIEHLELEVQQNNHEAYKEDTKKVNNIRFIKKEMPESYPEDEVDDEYLVEYDESMDKGESQGWKCFECKRVLHADVSYEGHLNIHKNVKPYKCTQCRSTFRCRNALEHHASKRHAHEKNALKCFTCEVCGKPFRLATLLLEHRRAEHKTLESCTRCGKSFKSEELLKEHMTIIHPPTNTIPLQCPYCSQPSMPKPRLVEHLRLQHPAEHRRHLHTVGRPCDENKVTPWQCEECFRYYRTEALLKDHRNTHTNERPHNCSVCDKRFFTANNLRSHMRSIHQAEYEKRLAESLDNVVQCSVCKKRLLQKNFDKHMLTHERKEKQTTEATTAKYLCAYCPRACKSRKSLNHHTKLHQSEESGITYECTECERHYATQQHLEQHRKQAHKERDHFCSICGNAFKLKNQLMNHMKLHLEKNIACPYCDKKYARQFDLNVHLRSHTGELPYACHLCERRFAIKVRLTYHLQKHLGIKHRCKECGAEFNSKQKLKAHSYKHTGMPYRCETCHNHGFANRDVFRLHITRVHSRTPSEAELTANFERNTGRATRVKDLQTQEFTKQKYLAKHEEGAHLLKQQDPQHTCPQCDKKFFQHKHLQAHMGRVHTQVRRHVCNICGNTFKGRSQLSAHIKLHMEKNLNCPHCEKKYARRADLTVHMRSHTGELPYACHLCNKRFAIKVRLTYHLQRHEGVKHPCTHCGAVYDNRNKLKEHMFKHTGMPYRCEECPGVEFSRRVRFINHMLRTHERQMSDEELAQMFAKNTGKAIRFKQLDNSNSTNPDFCDDSQDTKEFIRINNCKSTNET